MTDFKSKFNYLVFGLRLLFFILCIGLFFVFIFKAVPSFYSENQLGFKFIVGFLAGLFLTIFLPYRFGKILIAQRNNIIIEEGHLILKDVITSSERRINKDEIKGFSTTIYQTKAWNFKSIIFYFNSGVKLEFPQFLYWNYKDIKQALEKSKIQYLGHEPYRWKWFDTRHYQYD